MTVRDLLCHRSGLETFSGDLLWYESNYSRQEIIRRARFLKPESSFRTRFGYQNILFITAGEIVSVVSGKSWAEFIKERFFRPLTMAKSVINYKELIATPNVATPHNEKDGTLRKLKLGDIDNAWGAAGINSSVADMAQWIRLQLGRGTLAGNKIFSADRSREMWTPQTIVGGISEQAEKFNPTTHFSLYGLGWSISDYQGRKVVSHGGGLDGMISRVAMMPEENLGLVVLTNSESSVSTVISNKIFDVFLGVPKRDWNTEFLTRSKQNKQREAAAEKKVDEELVPNTKPSLSLSSYAGTYGGAMFGDARVKEENGKLVLRLVPSPNFVGDLEHWHFDTFRITWRDAIVYPFSRGFVTFLLDPKGKVSEMKIDVPNPDFIFTELEFKRQ
jgi:CubicO group peptidase (beta-lactamase class C family)